MKKIEKTTAKNGRVYYYAVDENGKKSRISEEKALEETEVVKIPTADKSESAEVKPVENTSNNESAKIKNPLEAVTSVFEKLDKIGKAKITTKFTELEIDILQNIQDAFFVNGLFGDRTKEGKEAWKLAKYETEQLYYLLDNNPDGDIDTSEEHRKDVKLVMDRAWYASGWWLGQMIDKYDAHTPYKLGKLRRACLNGDINYFSDSEKWNVKSYIEKKTEIKFEIQRFAEEADEVEEVKTAEKPLEYVNKTGDSVMAIRLINISKRGHVCRVYEISISTYGGEYTKQEGLGKGFKRHFENLEEAKRTIKKAAVRYGYVKAEIEENPTFDPQMIKLLDEYERITYEKAKARNKRNLEGLERAVKLGHERSGIYDQLLENNDYQKNHVVTLFAEIDKRVKRAERSADDEEAE